MSGTQGADELRIRSILQQRGVGPDAHETATRPDEPPAADPDGWWDDLYPEQPAPQPERQSAPRIPPWWEAKKPVTDTDPRAPIAASGDPAAPVPPKPAAPPRDWPDDIINDNATPAAVDQADETEEEEPEPDAPKPAAAVKTKPQVKAKKRKQKRSKRPGPNTTHTPWDSRPQDPRQSLIEAYDRVPYRLKWLAYHASAAYLGWSAGLVDYATYVTAWIAATGFGPQAWFWCGAGAATFLLYRRTRGLWWPVAWCAAVPATSTVVGVLLYAPTP